MNLISRTLSVRQTAIGAVLGIFLITAPAAHAISAINWFSPGPNDNLQSNGSAMDSGFVFQLGVFSGNFTPTAENVAEWEQNWNLAQSTNYNTGTKLFTSTYDVTENVGEFEEGRQAYIWGRNPTSGSGEWILMTSTGWLWPDDFFPSSEN